MPDYILRLTEEQVNVVNKACDLYSRVSAGQLEEAAEVASTFPSDEWRALFDGLIELHPVLGLPRNGHKGIGGASPSGQIAHGLHVVLRHRLAWDDQPEGGWQFIFDDPASLPKYGSEPLAEIERVSDGAAAGSQRGAPGERE